MPHLIKVDWQIQFMQLLKLAQPWCVYRQNAQSGMSSVDNFRSAVSCYSDCLDLIMIVGTVSFPSSRNQKISWSDGVSESRQPRLLMYSPIINIHFVQAW